MAFTQEPIFIWLSQFAYQPLLICFFIFGMMLISGFGFPMPEEVTIVSVGILTYMGKHPELFPPPYPGAPALNGYEAAIVTTFSVLCADFVVFTLGRVFGRRILQMPRFHKLFTGKIMNRINSFVKKYGIFAAFIFRFTPGIRFPAHVVLGMSQFPFWQFALVDAIAALISVPTQILLIYHYGQPILHTIGRFKVIIFSILGIVLLFMLIRKTWFFFSKGNESQAS